LLFRNDKPEALKVVADMFHCSFLGKGSITVDIRGKFDAFDFFAVLCGDMSSILIDITIKCLSI